MTTAETSLKGSVCPKCAANIRPGSVFCYNCGGRVEADEPKHEIGSNSEAVQPVAKESVKAPAPGLRSAADLRRRRRTAGINPKRISWEPVDHAADRQLIVVTVIVLIFTVVVVALAFYLR